MAQNLVIDMENMHQLLLEAQANFMRHMEDKRKTYGDRLKLDVMTSAERLDMDYYNLNLQLKPTMDSLQAKIEEMKISGVKKQKITPLQHCLKALYTQANVVVHIQELEEKNKTEQNPKIIAKNNRKIESLKLNKAGTIQNIFKYGTLLLPLFLLKNTATIITLAMKPSIIAIPLTILGIKTIGNIARIGSSKAAKYLQQNTLVELLLQKAKHLVKTPIAPQKTAMTEQNAEFLKQQKQYLLADSKNVKYQLKMLNAITPNPIKQAINVIKAVPKLVANACRLSINKANTKANNKIMAKLAQEKKYAGATLTLKNKNNIVFTRMSLAKTLGDVKYCEAKLSGLEKRIQKLEAKQAIKVAQGKKENKLQNHRINKLKRAASLMTNEMIQLRSKVSSIDRLMHVYDRYSLTPTTDEPTAPALATANIKPHNKHIHTKLVEKQKAKKSKQPTVEAPALASATVYPPLGFDFDEIATAAERCSQYIQQPFSPSFV